MEVWRRFKEVKKYYGLHPPSYLSYAKYFYWWRQLELIVRTKVESSKVETAMNRQYHRIKPSVPHSVTQALDNWKHPDKPSQIDLIIDMWRRPGKYLYTYKVPNTQLIDIERIWLTRPTTTPTISIPPGIKELVQSFETPELPLEVRKKMYPRDSTLHL